MYNNIVTLVTYDEKTNSIIKSVLNRVYLERKVGVTLSESGENTASNAILYVPLNKNDVINILKVVKKARPF